MTDLRELDFQIAERLFHLSVDREIGTMQAANEGVPRYSADNAALASVLDALRSRGFNVECRGKRAGSCTLYWARLLDEFDQEISSSGGWYETEAAAICQAVVQQTVPEWVPLARTGARLPYQRTRYQP